MTRHRFRGGFAALAMSAIGLMGLPTSAAAAGASVIVKVQQTSGLVSSYFQLKSHPGARANAGSLLLLNPTSQTIIVRVDPVAAITTDTLGSAYALRGGRAHGPGAWLKLSPRQVRIAPRSRRRINVSVTTPRSAKPGDYLSGVAVEALGQDGRAARTARRRDLPHGVSLGEIYRYAIGVEVSLPGPRHPHLYFTGARVDRDPAGVVFRIAARNDGNVILKNVTGQLTVTRDGRLVVSSRIVPGTFVTDSSIQLPVPAYRQHPSAGTVYRVQVNLTYIGGGAHLDEKVTFGNAAAKAQQNYGGPRVSSHHDTAWVYIAPSALALIILLGFAWRTRRRLPRRAAALAFLHSELTASQPGGRPLTVIHLDAANASRASRRRTAHALRRTLRKSDRIYDLDRDGMLIALPRTGPATAGELGSEIGDALRAQEVRFVGAPTSIDGIDPHELIAQAKTPPTPGAETATGASSIRGSVTTGSIASSQGAALSGRSRVEAEHARLAEIVRSSHDAIVSIDTELRIRSWNSGAEAMYGYSAEEVMGKSSDLLVPSDATLESRGLRERLTAGGAVHRYETKRLRKDGTLIDVAVTGFPLFDAADGAASIARDITAHNQAVRSLAESEARYREILDTTPDGVWRVDAENRTDYVNARMASMLGYTVEEMIGRELSDFMDPEWLNVAGEEMAKARREGHPGAVEHCWARKDGTPLWTRVSHVALTDRNGDHSGALAIMSDITASKAQAVELHASEHFLAALTDSMAEGMFAMNRDGQVTYMNHAAEKMLGWTKDELTARTMHDTTHYQHADGSPNPPADCPLLCALRTRTTIRVEDDDFTRRGGRTLPVAYSAAPITIDEHAGIVVVFSDVSARRVEEQRRKRELETLTWVGPIRDALDQDRLVLHAQPIIDLQSGDVVRHELLLRMVDRDGAMIAPGRFLPAAEQYGLIEEIDRWVLAQAVKLAARGLKMHFNISGKSLGSRKLLSDLVRALRDTGADPALLVCEITETALANDETVAEAFVHELTELGCEVMLDDFGMGYGGFAYLKRLPVTVLKIDMEFVRDLLENPQNQHVVKAIVTLAHGFGRQTIAEGVETESTLALLKDYGVDYAQGYLIGRPAPIHSLLVDGTPSAKSA